MIVRVTEKRCVFFAVQTGGFRYYLDKLGLQRVKVIYRCTRELKLRSSRV